MAILRTYRIDVILEAIAKLKLTLSNLETSSDGSTSSREEISRARCSLNYFQDLYDNFMSDDIDARVERDINGGKDDDR